MNAKQQEDKVFETDFIDSQKSDPPFAHLLALSHIYICLEHGKMIFLNDTLGDDDASPY